MKKNELSFTLKGRYALFTDPITKIGGEKSSLMLPTYAALKGVCESVYWKPSIIWFVDEVRVMNRVRTESKGIRTLNYGGGNDLSIYSYLSNVEYQVRCHFEFNRYRPELKEDWNENKHYFIAKRSLEKGGRRDIFLGVRECPAYVEPVKFGTGESFYKGSGRLEFGWQYHSLQYPDEQEKEELLVRFWIPKMDDGSILFCRPEECEKTRVIKKGKKGTFQFGKNFSGVEEKDILFGYEGGEED